MHVGILIGGVAVGALLGAILLKNSGNKKLSKDEILKNCFGEPMVSNTFSISEVNEWLQSRKDKLQSGAKAIVLKSTAENLKKIGVDLDVETSIKNYLVIAVLQKNESGEGNLVDSVLIKYEQLDSKLEEALNKGNGKLVVEA